MRFGRARIPSFWESVKNLRRLVKLERLFSFRISSLLLVVAVLLSFFIRGDVRLPLVVIEVLLLVFLYSIWVEDNLRCVEMERIFPETGSQDRAMRVKVRVTNRSGATFGKLMIGDLFPADLECQKERLDFRPLAPGESRVIEYQAACDGCFGTYAMPPLTLVASDIMGIFRKQIAVQTWQRFTLFPKLVAFPRFEPLGMSRYSSRGAEYMAKGDLNIAISGVRDYVPGDALRTIHWPMSAKHGRFIVKEFERQAVPTVHVLCDVHHEMLSRGLRTSGFERLMVAAVSLMRASSEAGLLANFAMHTESLHVRRLEPGIENFPAFLRWICEERDTGDVELAEMLASYGSFVRRGDVAIVLFSDWLEPVSRRISQMAPLVSAGAGVIAVVASENERGPVSPGVDWRLGESLGIPICFFQNPSELPTLIERCACREGG